MFTKPILYAVLLVGVSSFAMAQTTTTTPSISPTTGATSSSTTSKLTETQIRQKLQQQGYTDIQLKSGSGMSAGGAATTGSSAGTTGSGTSTKTSASNDMWTGTAMKSSKKVNIDVDANGKVTER
jgi:hypothetical protein